jgi:hypothetical protein
MAQKMLDIKKVSYSNKSTQTIENEDGEFCVYMTNNKLFRIYYSKSYKQYVLSFDFGNFKKYIITQSMWIIFRNYIQNIDKVILGYK